MSERESDIILNLSSLKSSVSVLLRRRDDNLESFSSSLISSN